MSMKGGGGGVLGERDTGCSSSNSPWVAALAALLAIVLLGSVGAVPAAAQVADTPLLTDDFTGPDESMWNEDLWEIRDPVPATATRFTDLQGGKGRMYSAKGTTPSSSVSMRLKQLFTDQDITLELQQIYFGLEPSRWDLYLRRTETAMYEVRKKSNENFVRIEKVVFSTTPGQSDLHTELARITVDDHTQPQMLRVQLSGPTMRVKLWQAGTTEPPAWRRVITPGPDGTGGLDLLGEGVTGIASGILSDPLYPNPEPKTVFVDNVSVSIPPAEGVVRTSAGSVDFGLVPPGQSATQTVTLTNAGQSAITVDGVDLEGPYTATLEGGAPRQLAAGATATLTITFSPQGDGALPGAVSVRHTGTNNPVRIPLTGSGGTQPGTLEASTTSLAFGDVRQGERPSQAVTLTNRGGAEVLVEAPALSGDQLDQFSAALPSAAPLRLAPGASTTLTVTFAPDRVGAASATVTVAHSGSNSAVTISASGTGQSGGGTQPQAGLSRLQASSRVETAVEVSRATFAPGIEVAYVATANNFPDALAAGPAAGRLGGPILLAGANLPVPQPTAEELDRLNPRRIVVLGGDTVLSEDVRATLVPYATSGEVTRLGGNNRYETAASISAAHFTPGVPVVYLASGEVFPDALSGGPAAARDGGPVLLVQSSGIPAATRAELQRLAPERVVVLGGALRIPDNVMSEAAGYATTKTATRMSGETRYGTAADVSAKTHPGGATVVYIATGENFPDALAAVPAAAKGQAPLLLVTPSGIPSEVDAELRRLNPSSIVVLGGETAVSNIVYGLLAGYTST